MTSSIAAVVIGVALMLGGSASAQQGPPSDVRSDIRSELRSHDDIVERYGSTATPELIEMLSSPSDVQYWRKAIGVLGMVGDDRAADGLIDFIERSPVDSDYISEEWHGARGEGLRALGFLIERTGNERALQYLIGSLDDTIWRRREVLGRVSYTRTYDKYDSDLSKYAIFGLALSGHPRAGEALRALQQSPAPNQERLRAGLDDVLDTWLEVHDLVAERGLEGMYEYYEQQRQREGSRSIKY